MNLRSRIQLTITGLLSLALLPTIALLTWTARQSLLERTKEDGVRIAQMLTQSASLVEQIPQDVEEVIGEQMVISSMIAAHLVDTAENRAGLNPDEINARLKTIVAQTQLDHIIITDEKGNAYLTTTPEYDFTFSPDPEEQPQAHVFWPLLTGEKQVVIQEARQREVPPDIFKYAGVSGIDRPRIVQVGYHFKLLENLRRQVGVEPLVSQLLNSENISGIWVVRSDLSSLASQVSDGWDLTSELSDADYERLRLAIKQKQIASQIEGPFLKISNPLLDSQGQIKGATLIYLSLNPVKVALRNQLLLAIAIAVLVFVLGLIASYLLARWITNPIERVSKASAALSAGNWEQAVPVKRSDELGILAKSFNSMAGQLKQSFEILEEKVQERTAELAQANQEISSLNEKLKAENLRLGAELDVARQIQQMILPKPEELEEIKGLDIAGFMEPADEVGGDYYDVLETDGIVTVGIGDVTGHGLESGLLMLMTQTAVCTLQEIREQDPVRFLDTLNRTIYRNVQRMNSDKNLTLAILNYSEGRVSITGQHEETLLVRAGGHIERIDTMDLGLPIGLDDDIADFIDHTIVELHPGDGVVVYTDGIPEAFNLKKKQYGMERLCEIISQNWQHNAQEIKQAVIDDLRAFIGGQKIFDDITLVILKQQ